MLPGSSRCELRLMLPDSRLGTDGFHDVLIDNLAASPFWRSGHISLADVTALRRRWPKAVFKTMRRRAQEVERLRRGAWHRPDRAFRHSAPGFCPVCEVRIDSALDVHMVNFHLELAQLWRCPVEWYAVWKGSVRGSPVTTRRRIDDVQPTGVRKICHIAESDIIRSNAPGIWSGTVSFGSLHVPAGQLTTWRRWGCGVRDLVMQ